MRRDELHRVAGGRQKHRRRDDHGRHIPANVPPHWLVYFAVDDVDASVKRAQELGAAVLMPVMDSPAGRFAVLADPERAAFAVIQVPSSG